MNVRSNGATGLLNTASLTAMTTSVSGLNKEQALLVLSTKNLTNAQKEQVLVSAGIIATEDKISASVLSQALAKSTLSATEKESLLTKLGLIDATTGEAVANATCTKETLLKTLATKGIVGADADAIISSIGLTTANGAQSASFDLLTASIWTNIKALGKWLITNPIGWAILGGTAIFGLVKAYDALTDSVDEVKDRTDGLMKSFNSAISKANENAKSVESVASRYEELSKGVNDLGENVSLTTDEYAEYNDVVNQISEMFPTLISGYTEEGNAILSLKGNVNELRDAYKEAQTEAYNLLIVSGEDSDGNDIITNYQNQINGNESSWSKNSSYIDGEAGAKDAIDVITKLTGALTPDEFRKAYNDLYEEYKNVWYSDKIQDALKSSGFRDVESKWSEITEEDLANVKHSAQATIQTYNAEIDANLKNVETLANAYLMTNDDYSKLSDQSKTATSLIVNNLNEDIANGFKTKEDVGAYVAEIVSMIKDNPDMNDALVGLFTLDSESLNPTQMKEQVDVFINKIAGWMGEDPVELKVRLGFDDTDDLATKYENAIKSAQGKFGTDETKFFTDNSINTPEEIDNWLKIAESANSAAEAEQKYLNPENGNETSLSFSDIISGVQSLSDGLDQLDKIYADVYDKDDFDWSSILNNEGFKESFGDLGDSYDDFISTISSSSDDINACQDSFNKLATAYIYSKTGLNEVTDATKDATVAMLTQMGVENAQEMVEARLAAQKFATANGCYSLESATYSEIASLISESDAANTTTGYLANLALSKMDVDNIKIDTKSDVSNIIAIANAAGASVAQCSALSSALATLGQSTGALAGAKHTLDLGDPTSLQSNMESIANVLKPVSDAKDTLQKTLQDIQNGAYNLNASDFYADYTGDSATKSAIDKANKDNGGSGSGSDSSAKESIETFDMLEIGINRCENRLDKFTSVAENGYKTLADRVGAYNNAINSTTEEINLQNAAYSAYIAKANSFGLEEGWAAQVRDGAINIADIADEGLKDRISGYKEWYEKALDAQNKVIELQNSLNELNVNKLQLSIDKVNSNLETMKSKSDSIQTRIDNDSRVTRKSDYDKQNKSYKQQIKNIEYTNTLLLQQRKYTEPNSEEWDNITSKIRENRDTIYDLTNKIAENKNLKIEIDISKAERSFDKLSQAIDKIKSKIDVKEAFGNTGSKSDYTAINTNIIKQIKNYQKQIALLQKQQKNVAKGSDAWKDYQDSIDSNKASINDLNLSIIENAKNIAALASTVANNKVGKLDSSDSLLQAKSDNYTSYKNQNAMIDQKIKNIASRQKAYNEAVSSDKSGLKSYTKSITNTSATKTNKAILKKVKSYVKAGKRIPDSVVASAEKIDASLGRKCAMYNAYFDQLEVDSATAKLYAQTSQQDKADLAKQKFDNLQNSYTNKTNTYSQRNTELQSEVDNASASGYRVSDAYYKKMIANEKKNNALLEEERSKLVSSLASSLKNGSIKKYSDEWYDMVSSINEVTNAIDSSNSSLIEYQNSLLQLNWDNFDKLEESISNVASENQFMIDELSREDLANADTGGLTDNGQAVMALHASNYEVYKQQAQDYAKKVEEINKQLTNDPYNETLLNQKQEYLKAEQDAISAYEDEKYAMIDLSKQGYQALENHISDLISDYKDLIKEMQDAYDYQKSIDDKTKQIGDIQKQLAAYSGDLSEENKSIVQKLNVSLKDAQADLKDTEYDKMLSNTSDMLDDLSEDMSDYIEDVVDALDENFDDLIKAVISNSSSSSETIINKMDEIDYSGGLRDIFEGNDDIISATKNALTDTKTFQEQMISYAKTIADTTTTNAGDEATKKANASIQASGKSKLESDVSKAQLDYNNNYTKARTQATADKESYNDYKEKAENAKYNYTRSKANGLKGKELQSLKYEYLKLSGLASESKEKYTSSKAYADTLKYNKIAMDYLANHLEVTTEPESSLSDLNKVLYKNYGQRVLANDEVKELASKLGISSTAQTSSGDLYKKLHALGIRGYKVGSKNILREQLALLGEEGSEIQFDKSQGVLRQVGEGDKIFTKEMADNLWNLAQTNPLSALTNIKIPDYSKMIPNVSSGGDVNIDLGGIVMNGVNSPEEFVSQLSNALNNKTIQKKLVNNTVGTLNKNYNSLSGRRY